MNPRAKQVIRVEIWDDIDPVIALSCVREVVKEGKISRSGNGTPRYCWLTTFATEEGPLAVSTRDYCKGDNMVVYKQSH